MDFSNRIYNQSTIDYSKSRKIPIRTLSSPDSRKKGKASTKDWVLKSFYNKPKAADIRPKSAAPNPKPSPTRTSKRIETPARKTADREGEPAIFFDESLVNSRAEKFKHCLVGRFPGSRPPLALIREWIGDQLKLKGEWSVTLLDPSHVFLRLENQLDMVHVWARKRWFIKGSLMKVFKWSPFFRTSDREEPSLAAVWVSFHSLPVVLFQEEFLFKIAGLVGKVLAMDGATRKMTRTNVARVCVEVDLLKELPKRLWIGFGKRGFGQEITYENMPSYCTHCLLQGHSAKTCGRGPPSDMMKQSFETSVKLQGDERQEQFSQGRIDNHINTEGSSGLLQRRFSDDETRKNKGKTETENREKSKDMQISKQKSLSVSAPNVEARSRISLLEGAEDGVALEEEILQKGNTEGGNADEEKEKKVCESLQKSELTEPITNRNNSKARSKRSPERRTVSYKKRFFFWKRKPKQTQANSILDVIGPIGLKQYKYSEIKQWITFDHVLGNGGFGTVYKGRLPDGRWVAIKIPVSVYGEEEFMREVETIGRTYHVNVISLVGFCLESSCRALVYEYMPNGSLNRFIHSEGEYPLGWEQLLLIAIGVARGLQYLHHGCSIGIVHFDIKPTNILLDEFLCPKISDFGLARPWRNSSSRTSMVRGTYGYIAPEHLLGERGTTKSDVYGYGVLLLEMAVRKKPVDRTTEDPHDRYLLEWVCNNVNRQPHPGLGLGGIAGIAEGEEARKMILVGLSCIRPDPSKRPSMNDVVNMLEGETDALQMPPDSETFFYNSAISPSLLTPSEPSTAKQSDEVSAVYSDSSLGILDGR
ncbi:uncharacterized protein [Aristolochia californica]|uniref:uncharacterized protein n=1 Tax=Aristolochia californica TaxID=171875 RepID=UPI0035D96766